MFRKRAPSTGFDTRFVLRWFRRGWCSLLLVFSFSALGADLEEAQQLFLSGNYTKCVALAEQALIKGPNSEDWQLLLTDALLTLGRYADARKVVTNALDIDEPNVRLRWLARDVFLSNGETDAANDMVDQIVQSAATGRAGYHDAGALVAIGRAALLKGAEPKRILDQLFNVAKKLNPKLRDVYLASGELALDKHDFALAAKTFQEGLKQLPDDPDLLFGLAQAYAPSEQALMIKSLEDALKRNSNHVGSLLLLADHAVDAEDYAEAGKILDQVDQINPWNPDAWSYRAVLANLQNQSQAEESARKTALKFWPANPHVDYLIGLKLSQKYRFAEGASHQRQALRFDAGHLPSKAQLAQDLLRLGEESEGWQLADEVQKKDGYDVTANNLVTLQDSMAKFQILTNEHFVVRMTSHEAALYGPRVLELLTQARDRLCTKYGFEIAQTTLVEVFAEQKDFAVRTFGLPQNDGYLGVCFGKVITANSPVSRPGLSFNWEAMLWHEFCHVVTLQLTQNKMPRWLSEGISVYEERQADPAWGEHLSPRYREMMLGDELTRVSKLSAAFLMPKSAVHLQFAYYESSLAVQFLVERFGFGKLTAILRDLGQGTEINQAIEKHTAPMAEIEKNFAAYAKQKAANMAPGLDWEKPDLKTMLLGVGGTTRAAWSKEHPTNFYAMTQQAHELVQEKKWTEAKSILQRLVALYPDSTGADSASRALAAAHRALGETNEERQVLARFAEKDDETTDVYLRLMELSAEKQDWPAMIQNSRRYLAVNPLVPVPYRFLAQAGEKSGDTQAAIQGYRCLLQLDPPNPAEAHFRLATQLHRVGDPAARREVLQALEEAPRYREALQLLLELNKPVATPQAVATPEARQ